MRKTISQLQAAASVTTSDVVAIDNAAGTATLKATVGQIVALAGGGGSLPNGTNDGDVLTWNSYMSSWGPATPFSPPAGTQGDVLTYSSGAWIAAAPSGGGIPAPGSPNDGDVLTWDNTASEWIAAAPTGGNSFDQTLNTTDAVEFASVSMANGSSLAEGSFDSGIGGNFGISLNCVVGYELNWQAGHLACTADGGVTLSSIVCDSPIQFNGTGGNSVVVNGDQITFPDSTIQTTALPTASNHSDMLYWDGTNSVWATTPGNPGLLPTGSSTGDILKWDSSLNYYVSAPSPVPTSANSNDVLAWNGSAWAAVMPSTPGLPSGTTGYYLRYDGANWNGDRIKLPTWNSGDSYNTDDVVVYANGTWRALQGGSNNTPSIGSSYWESIGLAPLAAGTNNGDVLTWDSSMSLWASAPPSGIAPPPTPADGDVLTYNSMNSAWEAAAPGGGGGGITVGYARSTSDETSGSGMLSASTSLTLPVASGETYQVEGLALLESDGTSQYADISLQLLATTSDGNVWFDCDIVDFSAGEVWAVAWNSSQTHVNAVGDSNGAFAGVVPIRFRGWVEVSSSISSSNVRVLFGDTSATSAVILKSGSWITATHLS